MIHHFWDVITIYCFSPKSEVLWNRRFWREFSFILQEPPWNDSRTHIGSKLRRARSRCGELSFWYRGVGVKIYPIFFRKLHKLVESYLSVIIDVNVFKNLSNIIVWQLNSNPFKTICKLIVTNKSSVLTIEVTKRFLKFLKLFFNLSPN